jgi:hypothetical protein
MRVTVRRLPAASCEHFLSGRCLFEERLNPGLHREWQCAVLRAWEGEYDDVLSRADAFGLDPGAALRLWAQRAGRMGRPARICPDLAPGGEEPLGCALAWELLCLRKVPACPGRCAHYRLRPAPAPGEAGGPAA